MVFAYWLRSCTVFTVCLAAISTTASAETITLELNDGGFEVDGELLAYDGKSFTIRSETLGRIKVDSSKFSCKGAGCPTEPDAADAIAAGAGNESQQPVADGIVNIVGSGTIGGRLVPELIRDYAKSLGGVVKESAKSNTHVVFDITGQDGKKILTFDLKREGSATAFPALAKGEADIGTSDRPISDREVGEIADAGTPDMNRASHEHVVGLDGIVVFTSQKVFIDSLSSYEIAQIFSGEITDWSELGYPSGKINVYATDSKSGTFRTFSSLVLKPFKKKLTPSAKRYQSNAELAKMVADDARGIGIASFAEISIARPVSIRDTCGLSYSPSEFSVKTGEYPLSRNLYFYIKQADSDVRAFLDFAVSDSAKPALKAAGFLDDNLVTARFSNFRDRVINSIGGDSEDFNLDLMKDLLSNFENSVRLSATMRFESNSSELDGESTQLLPKLVDHLKSLPSNELKVLVVGFSDKSGWFDANTELSLKRAQSVRDAIVLQSNGAIAPGNIEIRGYGELFPAACNDTGKGRDENRRVEIWLIPEANITPAILTKRF